MPALFRAVDSMAPGVQECQAVSWHAWQNKPVDIPGLVQRVRRLVAQSPVVRPTEKPAAGTSAAA
jgi:hypothetical protein